MEEGIRSLLKGRFEDEFKRLEEKLK